VNPEAHTPQSESLGSFEHHFSFSQTNAAGKFRGNQDRACALFIRSIAASKAACLFQRCS
jgi:hypothetical protein